MRYLNVIPRWPTLKLSTTILYINVIHSDKSELSIDSTVDEDTAFYDAKEEHGERKEIDKLTTNVDHVDIQNGS
jgi:hypothetical protein